MLRNVAEGTSPFFTPFVDQCGNAENKDRKRRQWIFDLNIFNYKPRHNPVLHAAAVAKDVAFAVRP
jgi:hypothetical protein|tara:strand:- start:938 stop:1135 length:198 start_codon:yes stop_codon:yes gene_type:complete